MLGVQATTSGLMLSVTSIEDRARTLHIGARELDPLAPGTQDETEVAGWRGDRLIFGGTADGRTAIFERAPDGAARVLHAGEVDELPLTVLGERVIFLARVQDEFGQLRALDASLVTPLGDPHVVETVLCAGDRAQPCYALAPSDGEMRAFPWDPATGAWGPEAARWPRYPNEDATGVGLSPDGTRFAIPLADGRIELLPLGGGAPAFRSCRACGAVQFATWAPDGRLITTGTDGDHRVGRVSPEGNDDGEVLLRDPDWLTDPRVSPDGGTVAVRVRHFAPSFWWVPAAELAGR
jgi:hypothetical protein